MPASSYYNDDPRYELMAERIENSNVFGGDAEMFKDDYLEILRLCYTYTIDDKWTARDLAEHIVDYLRGQWGSMNFEPYARAFWTPSETPSDTGSDTPSDTGSLSRSVGEPLSEPVAHGGLWDDTEGVAP